MIHISKNWFIFFFSCIVDKNNDGYETKEESGHLIKVSQGHYITDDVNKQWDADKLQNDGKSS